MSNRVQDRINSIEQRIKSGSISAGMLEDLNKKLKTEWKDLVDYQNLQAAAHAAGKLTTEEATQIYNALGGENPTEEKWDKLSLATKVAITQVMSELLDWRIRTGSGMQWVALEATRSKKAKPRSAKKRNTQSRLSGIRGLR